MKQEQIQETDTVEYQVFLTHEDGTETMFRSSDIWEAIAFYWSNQNNYLPYGLGIDMWANREDSNPVRIMDYDVRYDLLDWFLTECGLFSQENREQIIEKVNKIKLV